MVEMAVGASPKAFKVAIIGAGTGGLALATTLLKCGAPVSVKVFEQSDNIKARGGGIFLAHAMAVFQRLGMLDDFLKLANPLDDMEIVSSGQQLSKFKLPRPAHQIPRARLQQFLYDSLGATKEDVVQFGAKVVSIEEGGSGATLTFADGSSHVFDLVVGADGISSIVANDPKLFEPVGNPVWSGFQVLYAVSPKPVRKNRHLFSICYSVGPEPGTGKDKLYYKVSFSSGVGDDTFDAALIFHKTEQEISNAWDSEILGAEMSKVVGGAFADNHDSVFDIIDNSERVFRWGIYETPLRPTWISRGKKTMIIGDAAHAMTPFAGQGCNTAIQDGFSLGSRLSDALKAHKDGNIDVGAVLAQVEKIRKPSVDEQVQKSKNNGALQFATGCKRAARNCVFSCYGPKIFPRVFTTYDKDMPLDV